MIGVIENTLFDLATADEKALEPSSPRYASQPLHANRPSGVGQLAYHHTKANRS